MKFSTVVFIFFFLTAEVLFSQEKLQQDIEVVLNSSSSDASKIFALEKLSKKHSQSPLQGKIYAELGVLYFKNNDKQKSVAALSKSISILTKHKHIAWYVKELNRSRSNLVWIYRTDKNTRKQRQLLEAIVKDKSNDSYTFNANINIALLDAEQGDYYAAIQRLNWLLSQKNEVDQEIILRNNLVKVLAFMTEVDSGKALQDYHSLILKQLDFVETNFKNSNLEENIRYEFYNNLANIFESWNDNEKALQLYEKCKRFYKGQNKAQEYFLVLNNIGYLYAKQNKRKQALACFQEIIQNATDTNQIATGYDNLGYFSAQKPEAKILYFQKAIQTILEVKEAKFRLPALKTIVQSGYQQDILVYLLDLANGYTQCYAQKKQLHFLYDAKETLYLIDALVSLIRYESTSDQSKLFWIEKGVNAYLLATEVCYLLQQPEEAFYFMEKNKALLLQENIKKYQQKVVAQIPEYLLQKEHKLHQELLLLEKDFLEFPSDKNIKRSYFQKSKEFEKCRKEIFLQYPKYQYAKQKIDIVSLQKVKQNLTTNECFVSYIVQQQKGYGLFVNDKEKILFQIQNTPKLQQNISELKQLSTQFSLDKKGKVRYQRLSNSVFHSLFPFAKALEKLNNKKLTIVGDDFLLNFAFESLVVDTNQNLKDSYLVHFSEINYLHSFSVFQKIKNWENNAENAILAILPNQFNDNSLSPLTRTKELHDFLQTYATSTILEGDEATKERFGSIAKNYAIIHINSHAGIDKKTDISWIAFQKDKLALTDLYGISNQADLVILDACKTNEGEMLSGEGVMSLSRAFFSTGAKSVVSSLWNVNEKSGNEIIQLFYQNLEKGYSKSKALQLAKISYLKKHQLSEIVPYHWASFVLTGEANSISLEKKWYNNTTIVVVFSFILLVVLCGLFWYIRIKKKALSR